MIQIKKTILTLALLLTAVTGAWADQLASSYSSNATLNAVTVSASMEVTIATGVTVTINNGLNITSGTLTVTGPGTLVVNGAKGTDGGRRLNGGNGGNGGVAISGNIIVQGGATVTATGGTGGNGGKGDFEGGNGGNGGVAIAGTLTYKSGTVTANGGSAGSGGWGEDMERYASSGSAGKAFANDVDFTQTTGYSVTNGTSTIGSVLNQRKVVISGGSEPAASSGPKVAWDEDKKTGTFTMPGGNVTLEPEYYPQAALTAAPTAINDVPATTDGAIVKAGTVANIGTTETAQGTVMYYVSPTALDDAALLALAADKWTADVPTAKKLAKGEAYVYYYVRGNDSDTDEENFSDGDILSANALTVTIAAEPTYAVTFAEGTDPNEWTASPNAGVTKGTPVTVTYTGSKKVIGVKAEKKAAAPATVLSGALVDGAIIKVYFKWEGMNKGDYVQGVYNAASGTFTASKGGTFWATYSSAVYKVEKSGDNIIIGAGYYDYNNEAMVWSFNTTNDTYTTTYAGTANQWPEDFGLISVTLNGTDITSQLTAQ